MSGLTVGARPGRRRGGTADGPLPTFLVIGAMKAGTDSLWHYLRAHPHVHMSETKELDFFVSELNWCRGLHWYRSRFAGASPDALAVGEASTSYSKHPVHAGVTERIRDTLPDVRIVYAVRDPIERIRSQYQHQVLLRLEHRPIDVAVLEDSYVDFSRYAMQLERYLAWLPSDRVHVLVSEDLRADRRRTVEGVLRFLGVDEPLADEAMAGEHHATAAARLPRTGMAAVQRLPGYRWLVEHAPPELRTATAALRTRGLGPEAAAAVIPDGVRAQLQERLAPDVRRLRSLLGVTFDAWSC